MNERPFPAGPRRARSRGRARRRALSGAIAAGLLALLVPAVTAAHPLGNFTINHFAAVRVAPDRIALDVVIDRAEIPAFQEQQRLDANGDGTLQVSELDGQQVAGCNALALDLRLAVAGAPQTLSLAVAGLSQPPGAGGLSTMRLVCEYEALPAGSITSATAITFEDRSFAERIGWREIVVLGDGVTIAGQGRAPSTDGRGVSDRLTTYPTDLLTQPLDMRSVSVQATPGGPALPEWRAPDATTLATTPAAGAIVPIGAVPGGVGSELAALVDVQDLTPLAILVSLAIAFGLGIVHALSPGHGKTIMAAYLVGGRGSSRQAVGLGLAVAISHTLGVLVLALLTLAAAAVLPPERLYPILGVISGGLVVVIGGSLLWSRLRVLLATRAEGRAHAMAHAQGDEHDHRHEHGHGHGHEHEHEHGHSHAPTNASISWRGLIALGLSGGLVPSASALILLLGSIAAGRVAYGLVLVAGFGFGMAAVLTGIGLLLVHARRLIEHRSPATAVQRIALPIQLATATIVVVLGVVLTGQALTQVL